MPALLLRTTLNPNDEQRVKAGAIQDAPLCHANEVPFSTASELIHGGSSLAANANTRITEALSFRREPSDPFHPHPGPGKI